MNKKQMDKIIDEWSEKYDIYLYDLYDNASRDDIYELIKLVEKHKQ